MTDSSPVDQIIAVLRVSTQCSSASSSVETFANILGCEANTILQPSREYRRRSHVCGDLTTALSEDDFDRSTLKYVN